VTETGQEASLQELLRHWRDDLAAWAIPGEILRSVAESPWVLPGRVFARRADQLTATPAGPSFERAWAALDPPGSVLDIGTGAGAACLPLLPRTTTLTAVDAEPAMLELLAERTTARGLHADRVRLVNGRWPDVSAEVPSADVVTCHHVLYNVQDLAPFLAALTAHARRTVVVETTWTHPLTSLNELWLRFHGLRRPDRPTGEDLLGILAGMGLRTRHARWRRPGGPDYATFAELTDVTRRRLCLAPERADEVAAALTDLGVDPDHPQDLGSSGRDVVTIWWDGGAEPDSFRPARSARARPAPPGRLLSAN
jgi:SAM-dependent methyltransferase